MNGYQQRNRASRSWRHAVLLSMLLLPLMPVGPGGRFSAARAQGEERTFPETGKTVRGRFLEYWNTHGGLAQQGYPITEARPEISPTDGKTYTMQYFERAAFEAHPENQAPNDVLLSLLGVFYYKTKYPTGAPAQTPNNSPGSVLFPETGKRVGGVFLDYWQKNGRLEQQGYPISDEFSEVSDVNGKTYTVQYFQRAVFEHHPENQAPYDVLLSLIGTLWYRRQVLPPTPTAAPPAPTSTPMLVPTATNTAVPITSCVGIPPDESMRIDPKCAPLFTRFTLTGVGFHDDAAVGVWATMPNGQEFGAPFHVPIRRNGETLDVYLTVDEETPYYGIWVITMEGLASHRKAFGYFKLTPYIPTPPR